MERVLRWLIRVLSNKEWEEAMVAEADHLPEGADRRRWLAGAALTAVTESVILLRVGGLAGVCVAGSLVSYAIWRYPSAVGGDGGTVYLTLVVVLLSAFAGGFVWLTRPRPLGGALRRGTASGVVAAALAGTAAMPFGGPFTELSPMLRAITLPLWISAVGAVIAMTAARMMRRTGDTRPAFVAGMSAAMVMTLLAFIVGFGEAVFAPQLLPIDPAVAANHTGGDLIGANLGETAVVYILGLIGGPILGFVAAALGIAIAQWRPQSNGDPEADGNEITRGG